MSETETNPAATPAPAPAARGWRDGLHDLGRGMEFGMWVAALASWPVAGFLLGVSLAMVQIFNSMSSMAWGLIAYAARSALICIAMGVVFAMPVGLAAWLYRGIAIRRGWSGPDVATRRRRRRRRWAFVAAMGTVAVVAGVATMTCLDRYATRSAREAIAATVASDPGWRFSDVMTDREAVPDEENSALVAAAAFNLLPNPWPPKPPHEGESQEPETLDVATALERVAKADDSRRLDDAIVEAIRADLETHREAVALARSLVDYDRGRHDIEPGLNLFDIPLPDTQNVRTIPPLLRADAILSAQFGEFDAALDSCRAIVASARAIGDEPFLVSQHVRLSMDGFVEPTVRRVLGQGEPSDAALAMLQDLLYDEREQPRLWWGVRGERALLVEMIRRLADGEVSLGDLANGRPISAVGKSGYMVVAGKYQISVALRWFDELIAILDRPEREWMAAYQLWDAKIAAAAKSRFSKYTTTFPVLMMPSARAVFDTELFIRAQFGAMIVLLGAERHRQEHGRWPASETEIDEDLLPEAPLDPYSGSTYLMEHVDGRLRVYSVGPNGRDEHGSYDRAKWTRRTTDDDVGTFAYDPELRGRPAEGEP